MPIKTQVSDGDIHEYLNQFKDEERYDDLIEILNLMQTITNETPKLWSNQIIGFGTYTYSTKSTGENQWFLTGFSPRKQNISLHIMSGFEAEPELMKALGNYKTGKSCLYIKRLSDINKTLLSDLIKGSIKTLKS